MVFGVVDEDYYGNIDNDGEIGFEFYNILDDAVTIKKGEKLVCKRLISYNSLIS